MIAIYIILASVCVLLALWLFLIAPGSKRGMEKYRYVKYAHRGLHGTVGADTYAAENSLTAFRRAKEYGFGIELDVRLTKDGELVVFHDNTLDRVTNGKGEVIEHTLAELRELSLSGTEDTVPTLDEVLELIDGAVPLLVELKENGTDNSVGKKCAERLKTYGGDYIVESFSPMPFGEVRRVLPDVPCGFLADKLTENERFRTFKYKIVESFLLNCVARPAFIAVNHKRPRMFPLPLIRALFSVPTIAWTVRSAEEEKTAYENGFDSVIFEGYMPDGTVAPGGQASDHKEK